MLATPARKLPRVITCSNCGEQKPERARFCLRCGSSLIGAPTPDEERKIVTVLFFETAPPAAASWSPDGPATPSNGSGAPGAILSPLGVRPLLEEIDGLLGEETAPSS